MTNARIERMIREVNAEPASDFVVSFLALIERFWPKVTAATRRRPRAGPPLPPVTGQGSTRRSRPRRLPGSHHLVHQPVHPRTRQPLQQPLAGAG